jgi:hypothetical protein
VTTLFITSSKIWPEASLGLPSLLVEVDIFTSARPLGELSWVLFSQGERERKSPSLVLGLLLSSVDKRHVLSSP